MLMCDPGTVEEGRFANSIAPYNKVVAKGKHVCGFVQSISTTHVEVGNERTVVPFDYLIMAMGSSYVRGLAVSILSLRT